MTAQALPLTALTSEAVIEGMGAFWGYVPCTSFLVARDIVDQVRDAWRDYFAAIGYDNIAPTTVRYDNARFLLNFNALGEAAGLTIPDMASKIPIGAGNVPLNTTDSYLEKTDSATYRSVYGLNFLIKVI